MKKTIAALLIIGSLAVFSNAAKADSTLDEHLGDKRGESNAPAAQGIYSKPFWKKVGRGTYLGGYADFEYRNRQDAKQKFEVVRMVPFIYADVAPGIRFASEIEFEHGGATEENTGDAAVEFAFLDYDLLGENLGLRAGILLNPLGKFNLIHDSPINDLNDRPMVDKTILPTTLSEPGAGFFGTSYLDPVKLDYQIYVTQGFNGGATGKSFIDTSNGIRSARSAVNGAGDNNESLSYSGRLGVSPRLGTEIGFSFHTGNWDNAGENNLRILALDWAFQWRNLEFLGEYGNAAIGRNATTDVSVPGNMEGYYLQANAHFLQDAVRPGSVFTGVLRWDHQDLDLSNETSTNTDNRKQRLTFGLNFRPIEQTVFKLDYQINYEDSAATRVSNNAWILGFATYF